MNENSLVLLCVFNLNLYFCSMYIPVSVFIVPTWISCLLHEVQENGREVCWFVLVQSIGFNGTNRRFVLFVR